MSNHNYFRVVEDCLAPEFCNYLIELGERVGFVESTLNGVPARDFRRSLSCKLDLIDPLSGLSGQHLYEFKKAIMANLPKVYKGKTLVDVTSNSLNILKYGTGDYFKRHTDGSWYDSSRNLCSLITCQVYLNTLSKDQGGSTIFYNDDGSLYMDYIPKQGSVVFFDHMWLHEGGLMLKGTKYAFRISALYSR